MMISLPAKWIKEYNLKKGSEIEIEEVDDNLIVSATPVDVKSETCIKLGNLKEVSIRTLIANTYRRGYDRIKVNFDNEEQFKILNDAIKTKLIGFEVTKKEKNYCIVENITEPSPDQFDALIRKIFYNLTSFIEITEDRLKGKENGWNFEEVAERIQKYDNFCKRVISKKKLQNKKSEFLWTFLTKLVHASRELFHLNNLITNKTKASENVIEILEGAKEISELIKNAYLQQSLDNILKIHEQSNLLREKGYSFLETKGKENLIIHHVMNYIRTLHLSTSSLTGIII